jgi:hypothetical protein
MYLFPYEEVKQLEPYFRTQCGGYPGGDWGRLLLVGTKLPLMALASVCTMVVHMRSVPYYVFGFGLMLAGLLTSFVAALNSGGSPVTFSALGAPKLVRQVTSYSLLPGTANADYRCREGHIPSVMHIFWAALYARRLATKQPFLSRVDPPAETKPLPNTDYPSTVRAEVAALIDNFTSAKPLDKYDGPILDPATASAMKASITTGTTANGGGGLTIQDNLTSVLHNNTYEAKILEVSAAQ